MLSPCGRRLIPQFRCIVGVTRCVACGICIWAVACSTWTFRPSMLPAPYALVLLAPANGVENMFQPFISPMVKKSQHDQSRQQRPTVPKGSEKPTSKLYLSSFLVDTQRLQFSEQCLVKRWLYMALIVSNIPIQHRCSLQCVLVIYGLIDDNNMCI